MPQHQDQRQQNRSCFLCLRNWSSSTNQETPNSTKGFHWCGQRKCIRREHAHGCCDLSKTRGQGDCAVWGHRRDRRLCTVLSVTTDLPSTATTRRTQSVLEVAYTRARTADVGKATIARAIGIGLGVTIVLSSDRCAKREEQEWDQRESIIERGSHRIGQHGAQRKRTAMGRKKRGGSSYLTMNRIREGQRPGSLECKGARCLANSIAEMVYGIKISKVQTGICDRCHHQKCI
jgi:hypothetical protein